MLIEEAKWFGQKISVMPPANIFPMLNVGSGRDKFRRIWRPWIDEYIFKPIREKKQSVQHLDIKDLPGVDIVGDLSDPNFLKELSKKNFKSVFCSNLLEHVLNREQICRVLNAIIPVGGYIFVSCPFRYPYHPAPIDTMFRPNMNELAGVFPHMRLVHGEIVTGGTYFDSVSISPLKLMKTIIRLFLSFYRPKGWFIAVNHVPWLFRNFQATCLVLRKDSEQALRGVTLS